MDDAFLILVNAYHEGINFTLPRPLRGKNWIQIVDTEKLDAPFTETPVDEKVILGGRSIRIYKDGMNSKNPD